MFASHQRKVKRCSAEISALLPALAAKYNTLVLLAAFTEHVGGTLYLTQYARHHSPRQVRRIIERVRKIALSS